MSLILCVALLLIAIFLCCHAERRYEDTLKKIEVIEAEREVLEKVVDNTLKGVQAAQAWVESQRLEHPMETDKQVYISPSLEKVMRRYAEQLRRVKKWEHYAAHAKKVRTRKKYRNRLREYYSREPTFMPAGLDSGHGMDSTAGGWWLRAPSPGEEYAYALKSILGDFTWVPPVLWNYHE